MSTDINFTFKGLPQSSCRDFKGQACLVNADWEVEIDCDLTEPILAETIIHEVLEAYMVTNGWHYDHEDVRELAIFLSDFVFKYGFKPKEVIDGENKVQIMQTDICEER